MSEDIRVRKCTIIILFFISMCSGSKPKCIAASIPIKIFVEPDQILMGASYNGIDISVSGEIPAYSDALIRVKGSPEDSRFKKKGRALGVLWMNLGSVEFQNVPSVFLIYPSEGVNKFLQADRKKWQDLGISLEAIGRKVAVISDSKDKDVLFKEFIKLRQKSGLYGTVEEGIHYGEEKEGMKSFSCSLRLPPGLPQGLYKVEVFAIRGGVIAGYGAEEIEAKETGMPALIASFAFNHGTLYGILAVLVAVIAGLLTGVMFKGEKRAH
jgi:uncharacterized protein (TIGR02186 family)